MTLTSHHKYDIHTKHQSHIYTYACYVGTLVYTRTCETKHPIFPISNKILWQSSDNEFSLGESGIFLASSSRNVKHICHNYSVFHIVWSVLDRQTNFYIAPVRPQLAQAVVRIYFIIYIYVYLDGGVQWVHVHRALFCSA